MRITVEDKTKLMMPEIANLAYEWKDCALVTEVLPTEYSAAGARMRSIIAHMEFDAIIGFGVSTSVAGFVLERCALNINDSEVPDNAGWMVPGISIVPLAYESTLSLSEILAALQYARIPAAYSYDAGMYVCNHVFYVARHEVEICKLHIPYDFIHIPFDFEGSAEILRYGIPGSRLVSGVQICLTVLKRHLLGKSASSFQQGFPSPRRS